MTLRNAKETLQRTFGFDDFRPGQEAVIERLLAGRSSVALFPTGSGKSLCYQLPALLLPGVTLVVSPLIALMREQSERLRSLGVAAASLDSSLSAEESRTVMSDLRAGRLRLLFLAPERFNNERTREALLGLHVSLFAVDEAHCISEWGHNFRPDYLKLAGFARRCGAERILALTATATPDVLKDICRGLGIAPADAVRTGFYRPNLNLHVTPAATGREALLVRRLQERPPGVAVVYVTTQKTAERLATYLAEAGLPARAYHAGMDAEVRGEVQTWFADADQAIVVATIAFGMGIDKANIRAVYHYNLPKSLENYSQEIGRAGRDGDPADCEMLYAPEDLGRLENFAYGDTPDLANVQSLIVALFEGEDDDLRLDLYDLSNKHDLRSSVLSTLLTYLELEGYLEAGTPVYARYRFQPNGTSAEILAKFEGEHRTFLANVLRQSVKARTWFDIDLEQTAKVVGASRERVVAALDQLGELGHLTLKAEGLRHRYKRRRIPADQNGLAAKLHERTLDREAREVARLQQVVELAGLDGCQTSHLGAYFGEPLSAPCGHCTWCRAKGRPTTLPPRPATNVDPDVLRRALELRRTHPDPLAQPRSLARFLCGLPSPRLSQKRLTGHALYGALELVPFKRVLEAVAAASA